ncbi:methyltransferase [Thelephora ganbajun]|uniref:Methyltransferase n=1 Tax=Thelephora ganbajun TaxID=370292 RepID=A0ACB6ZAY1_THEGA|nr:methyltransferase [Thelephora ganbajun]
MTGDHGLEATTSALTLNEKEVEPKHRAPFGSRFLTDGQDVWSHNAWDRVPPPDDQDEIVVAAMAKQRSLPVSEEEKAKINAKPSRNWDNFYKNNANNFFRDRNWCIQSNLSVSPRINWLALPCRLSIEFPEAVAATTADAGPMTVAEIGCGAGNTVFPLLAMNKNPHLSLRAYDYSPHAVKLVQRNPAYESPPMGDIKAGVWDLSSDQLPGDLEPESVDIAVFIFVLSALHPNEWFNAMKNVHRMLKPGGLLLLRDYGRHDLAQLRFKTKRLLEDNFYIRGDKTRVYFFETDELALLFSGASAPPESYTISAQPVVVEELERDVETPSKDVTPAIETPLESMTQSDPPVTSELAGHEDSAGERPPSPPDYSDPRAKFGALHPNFKSQAFLDIPHPLFEVVVLAPDRRLLVNRKRQLKMYRIWMQGKFRKIVQHDAFGGENRVVETV